MTLTVDAPPSEIDATDRADAPRAWDGPARAIIGFASWAWKPALMWLGARTLIALVWAVRSNYRFGSSIWDSVWYHTIVTSGYSLDTPMFADREGAANVAFFPAYPLLSRLVWKVTGLNSYWSMHVVAHVCGLIATVMLWAFVRSLWDARRANLATAMFAFSTGSFALSMLYSEGLFLVAAIGCCWMLVRERYLLAGLLGALGTATRPTGVVLVGVCAVAAWYAPERRRLEAIAATLLSATGIAGYLTWLWGMSGSWSTYFEVQRAGWGDHTSLIGGRAFELRALFDRGFMGGEYFGVAVVSIIGFLTVVLGVRRLVAENAHPVLLAYSFAMAALLWTSYVVGYRPRMVMVIFPVFIGLAGVFGTRARFAAWMTFSTVAAVFLAGLYLTGSVLIP